MSSLLPESQKAPCQSQAAPCLRIQVMAISKANIIFHSLYLNFSELLITPYCFGSKRNEDSSNALPGPPLPALSSPHS